MRRLLFITLLLLGAVFLQYRITEAQTSPTLNTMTGPYRGPHTIATVKTVADSIIALEARLHLVILDTTAATNDSIALIRAAIVALQARYEVDSAATPGLIADSLAPVHARIDTAFCIWVTAGDTTSPGLFYAPDTSTGKFVRADSSLLRRACIVGVAVDSINKDGVVRIQTGGTVSFAWWAGLLGGVGTTAVNDSVDASKPAPADASRTNTLPMQALGTALDSITIRLNIGEVWYYEE
jgi:hypothetical protein